MTYKQLGKGVVKRSVRRVTGVFIDGTGLDRATRRLHKRINMSALVRGITSGIPPHLVRYYTLIPNEDDSRHRAFLDAVARSGLQVVVKRLPPKGISRQVSVDLEMAADIVAFAFGHSNFRAQAEFQEEPMEDFNQDQGPQRIGGLMPGRKIHQAGENGAASDEAAPEHSATQATELAPEMVATETNQLKEVRGIIVVCPSRELSYPISIAKEVGVDTTTVDFGKFNSGDVLKSAAKWIDLSDSETIWKE